MPHRLLSQLVHVELLTPTLGESVEFAVDILGLDVVEDAGDSVYLRCWGDYYAHSVILTAADEEGGSLELLRPGLQSVGISPRPVIFTAEDARPPHPPEPERSSA